jgi:putative transcriptional regulator
MNRIKLILAEQGRSQKWLARHIGRSYVVVNCYVNNHRQPTIGMLFQMSHVLNVDVRELLDPKAKAKPDQIKKGRGRKLGDFADRLIKESKKRSRILKQKMKQRD